MVLPRTEFANEPFAYYTTIEWKDILEYVYAPWNWIYISQHKNITCEIIDNPHLFAASYP